MKHFPPGATAMSPQQFKRRWSVLLDLRRQNRHQSFAELAESYQRQTGHRITRQRVHQVIKRAGL